MEFVNIFLGIGLIGIFTWLLLRNLKRSGFINAVFRFDTIVGIVAGLYLLVSSIHSLVM